MPFMIYNATDRALDSVVVSVYRETQRTGNYVPVNETALDTDLQAIDAFAPMRAA